MGNLEGRIEALEQGQATDDDTGLIVEMNPVLARNYEEAVAGLGDPNRVTLVPPEIRRRWELENCGGGK